MPARGPPTLTSRALPHTWLPDYVARRALAGSPGCLREVNGQPLGRRVLAR